MLVVYSCDLGLCKLCLLSTNLHVLVLCSGALLWCFALVLFFGCFALLFVLVLCNSNLSVAELDAVLQACSDMWGCKANVVRKCAFDRLQERYNLDKRGIFSDEPALQSALASARKVINFFAQHGVASEHSLGALEAACNFAGHFYNRNINLELGASMKLLRDHKCSGSVVEAVGCFVWSLTNDDVDKYLKPVDVSFVAQQLHIKSLVLGAQKGYLLLLRKFCNCKNVFHAAVKPAVAAVMALLQYDDTDVAPHQGGLIDPICDVLQRIFDTFGVEVFAAPDMQTLSRAATCVPWRWSNLERFVRLLEVFLQQPRGLACLKDGQALEATTVAVNLVVFLERSATWPTDNTIRPVCSILLMLAGEEASVTILDDALQGRLTAMLLRVLNQRVKERFYFVNSVQHMLIKLLTNASTCSRIAFRKQQGKKIMGNLELWLGLEEKAAAVVFDIKKPIKKPIKKKAHNVIHAVVPDGYLRKRTKKN